MNSYRRFKEDLILASVAYDVAECGDEGQQC